MATYIILNMGLIKLEYFNQVRPIGYIYQKTQSSCFRGSRPRRLLLKEAKVHAANGNCRRDGLRRSVAARTLKPSLDYGRLAEAMGCREVPGDVVPADVQHGSDGNHGALTKCTRVVSRCSWRAQNEQMD